MYGDVQPVYALTTVGVWLQETGLMEEFEEYLELTNQKNVRTN